MNTRQIERRKARQEKLQKMFSEDISVAAIASALNVSTQTICKDLLALGLRRKGEYPRPHREAIARGVRKSKKPTGPVFCCVCRKLGVARYRREWYCGDHLMTAGNCNPHYMKQKRESAGQRHTSHGRTEG